MFKVFYTFYTFTRVLHECFLDECLNAVDKILSQLKPVFVLVYQVRAQQNLTYPP